MFYISDENERSKERPAENTHRDSNNLSPSDLHSLKSLDFFDSPELELYSSTPKSPRSAHKRKNKSKRSRQHRSSIKDTFPYSHNGLMSNVFDSESESMETSRPNNPFGLSKSLTKSRNSDRNLKQQNNHGSFLEGVENGSGPSSLPSVVVTSQKYKCLDSMPVSKSITELESSLKTCPPRFTNVSSPFIGSDRVSFYTNFSLLIDLGKSRDKDTRRHACNRQMSSEEELWRSQFGDVVWLELQAHLNQMQPSQQDACFMRCRENIPKMIEGMLFFRVSPEAYNHSPQLVKPDVCSCSNVAFDDPIPSAESMFGSCPGKVLQSFYEAAGQAVGMMQKLDYIESLYPTQRALLKGCPMYGSEELQRRISTLYLWFNISRDLFQQLKSILDLVTFSKYKECSLWSCIDPSIINLILQTFGMLSTKGNFTSTGPYLDTNGSILSLSMAENLEDESIEPEHVEKNIDYDEDNDDDNDEEEDIEDDESMDNDAESEDNASNQHVKGVTFEFDGMTGFDGGRLFSKSSITSADSFETIPTSTTSIYRHYVDRNLKRTGMKKFCKRLKQMMDKTLSKTQQALLSMGTTINKSEGKTIQQYMVEMGLPSFSCIYHFLCHVPLDIIHECLKLRLERQPKREPSLYILRTLIHECKEVLSSVLEWRHYYLKLISTIQCTSVHEVEMEKLEDDLMKMLQVYFGHMQQFMNELQQLPEMSKELKNFLEREWNFMKICSSIRNGEAFAGNKFCAMASSLIRSISDFLDSKIDGCINQLFANSSFESPTSAEPMRSKSSEFRQCMLQLSRDLKLHFNEARERSYKAGAFAKMLKKDLEVATQYMPAAPLKVILDCLYLADHVQIIFPEKLNYLTFVPRNISSNKYYVCRLLKVSTGWEVPPVNGELLGYVVITRVEDGGSVEWKGEKVIIESTPEINVSLDHLEVNGWLLLAMHSHQLATFRKMFEDLMEDRLHLKREQMSCCRAISDSLDELKACALDLRVRIVEGLSRIIESFNDAELVDVEESEKNNVLKSNRETINYCFTFAFEYHKELLRLTSGDVKGDLSRAMIEFARLWMNFAHSCDRGRGVKPRWASHGFEFLKISCEPKNLNYLNDEEFIALTKDINCCISHVIGNKPTGCSPDIVNQSKSVLKNLSLSGRRSYASPSRSISNNSNNSSAVISSASSYSALKNSFDLSNDDLTESITALRRSSRQRRGMLAMSAINGLERDRNEALMRNKVIGRVSSARPDVDSAVKMRRVKFKWQRGIKIGEGQFGKVYIAINLDNDVLMAMKEIKLQANDHQAIRKIDEEIKTFEGIKHKSLVQYFGIELYRDEMIIFMEYCQNGTIEDLAKLGLDEHMVRKYSNEILQAIYILHYHDIVHRDIKGANIFLMPTNSIKLGDFGCSVKLKSHTTMAGELNDYVGTPAFMAPEVIKGNSLKGYGRAADIWSFGCVIIQMVTGQRPWPELESKIQIFFKVGSGAVPQIPEVLSEEGKEFLSHCLETDDEKRWTAEQLMDHPFVKISEDEDLET